MGFKKLDVKDFRRHSGRIAEPTITITKTGLIKFSKAWFEKYGMLPDGKDMSKDKLGIQLLFDEKTLVLAIIFMKNAKKDNGNFPLHRSGANIPNCANISGMLNHYLNRKVGSGSASHIERFKKNYLFEWKANVVIEEDDVKAVNAFTISLSQMFAQEMRKQS